MTLNIKKILAVTVSLIIACNAAWAQNTPKPVPATIKEVNKLLKQQEQEHTAKDIKEPTPEEIKPLEEKNTPIAKKIIQQTNSIVKIQVQNNTGKEKIAVGSGSILTTDGLIVTNYHVISAHFIDPITTSIIFNIGKNSEDHLAQLEAVDLVNDLAFIKPLTALKSKPLILESNELQRGEKVFSVGFPHNWSMTMIEGYYNGYMDKQLIPHYLVSHSLSSGMSGGPTFSENGKLAAVNVAATNKLSILIPVESVVNLLKYYSDEQGKYSNSKNYNDKIKLIRENALNRYSLFSDNLLSKVMQSQDVSIGKFNLPLKNSLYECWSRQTHGSDVGSLDKINILPKEKLVQTQRTCSTQDSIFLQDNNDISQITLNTYHYQQPGSPNMLVLWKTIEKKFNLIALQNEGSAKAYSGSCFYRNVTNNNKKLQKIQICVSPLKETNKLWQIQVAQILYDKFDQAVVIDSLFDGFTEKSIPKIISYMKSI